MMNPLLPYVDNADAAIAAFKVQINWARDVLKRQDRVWWFLRLARISLAINNSKSRYNHENEDLLKIIDNMVTDAGLNQNRYFSSLSAATGNRIGNYKNNLRHFMGLPIPAIQNIVFGKQDPELLHAEMSKIEQEWHDQRDAENAAKKQMVEPEGEVLIDFRDGWAWYRLDRASCDMEADAMGHCGNSFGNPHDRILSLRKTMPDGKHRPSLTFIISATGQLGEMKGRANAKPSPKYHTYIAALLRNPLVKGIIGGGYDPGNNFAITDLPEELRAELYEEKPELMPCGEYLKVHGIDDYLTDSIRERLSELPGGNLFHYMDAGFGISNGRNIFYFEAFDHWKDALMDVGSGGIKELLDQEIYIELGDDWVSGMINDLPISTQEKILSHMVEEYGDELRDAEVDIDDEEEIWAYVEKTEEPDDLYEELRHACEQGYREGTQQSIDSSLREECDLGGGFEIETEPSDDGYRIICTMEAICDLVENPNSPLLRDITLSEFELHDIGEELWGSLPSVNDDLSNYYSYSKEDAVRTFLENSEFAPDVPALEPVGSMSHADLRAELNHYGRDDAWIDRYYGSSFAKQLPDGVRRERLRQFGVEDNPSTEEQFNLPFGR